MRGFALGSARYLAKLCYRLRVKCRVHSRVLYFLRRLASSRFVVCSYSSKEVYSVIDWFPCAGSIYKFKNRKEDHNSEWPCSISIEGTSIISILFKNKTSPMANLLELTSQQLQKQLQSQKQMTVYGNTNQTLYQDSKSQQFIYYMPAYMQLQFNSIAKVDYSILQSHVHCDINFILNVKGMPDFVIAHLKNNIHFYFNNDKSIRLKQTEGGEEEEEQNDMSEDEDDEQKPEIFIDEEIQMRNREQIYHYLIFNIRKQFVTGMVANVDWTPFELIDLILSVFPKVLKSIKIKDVIKQKREEDENFNEEEWKQTLPLQLQERMELHRSFNEENKPKKPKQLKQILFRINLMDCPQKKANTIFFEVNRNFGIYSVATKKILVEYVNVNSPQKIIEKANETNKKIEVEEGTQKISTDNNKIKNYECAHFIITLYKIPNSAVATIFLPILLLCIINLGIFNQDKVLSGRIQNLAALMLAFIAVFPVIREQIPPNPKITYMEILVYLLTGTDLLCLIESVLIRGQGPVENITTDPFFLTTLCVSIITLLAVIILMMLHKLKWEPDYLIKNKEAYFPDERFDHFRWKNQACDQHFMKFFDNKRIKPVVYK